MISNFQLSAAGDELSPLSLMFVEVFTLISDFIVVFHILIPAILQ